MNFIKNHSIIFFFLFLSILALSTYWLNQSNLPGPLPRYMPYSNVDIDEVGYFTIEDHEGNVILETAFEVHVNDEYINEKDIHYIITHVEGREGIAQPKEIKEQAEVLSDESFYQNTNSFSLTERFFSSNALPVQAPRPIHIAIYQTHTDESYIPDSGTASKRGAGDIIEVGAALANALRKAGISVTHSRNTHDPHDINAYHRSRKTAVELIKEQPDAVFDIHRDAAPTSAYQTRLNGIDTARVMIVIGRSNPNMQTNLAYARKIKAESDSIYPGLMRGIFMGRGSYNQELYPTALLFEVGTDKLSLDSAINGAKALADTIIRVKFNEDEE